jgi:hypothetical protein
MSALDPVGSLFLGILFLFHMIYLISFANFPFPPFSSIDRNLGERGVIVTEDTWSKSAENAILFWSR